MALWAGGPDRVSATALIDRFISSRANQQSTTPYMSWWRMVRPLLAGSGLVPARVANAESSRYRRGGKAGDHLGGAPPTTATAPRWF
jgi:hypothetical protein